MMKCKLGAFGIPEVRYEVELQFWCRSSVEFPLLSSWLVWLFVVVCVRPVENVGEINVRRFGVFCVMLRSVVVGVLFTGVRVSLHPGLWPWMTQAEETLADSHESVPHRRCPVSVAAH